jgi:hypothetical protein
MTTLNTIWYGFNTNTATRPVRTTSTQLWNTSTFFNVSISASDTTANDINFTVANVSGAAWYFGGQSGIDYGGLTAVLGTFGDAPFSSVQLTNNSDGSYTTETTDASSRATNDVALSTFGTTSSRWYFGRNQIFHGIHFIKQNAGTMTGGILVWEYWNGATWTQFTPRIAIGEDLNLTTGSTALQVFEYVWDGAALSNWAKTSVNGSSAYYIRARVSQAYTNISTFSVIHAIAGVWQYWNGTDWLTIPHYGTKTKTALLSTVSTGFAEINTEVLWNPNEMPGWTDTTVNSVTARYVRYLLSGNFSSGPPRGTYVAVAPYFNLNPITVYIPETSQRKFRSVAADVTSVIADDASDSRALNIFIKYDSSPWRKYTRGEVLADTGETYTSGETFNICGDFATYIGNSTSIPVSACIVHHVDYEATTTSFVANGNCEMNFTYEYDGTAHPNNAIKTVILPLETPKSPPISSNYVQLGVGPVPAITGYLPEANKVFRQSYIRLFGSSNSLNTTVPAQYVLKAGSLADVSSGNFLNQGQSSFEVNGVHDVLPLSGTSYDLRLKVAHQNCNYRFLSAFNVITYEYDPENTTRVLNSVQLIGPERSDTLNESTSGNAKPMRFLYNINEPGNIVLKKSAVHFIANDGNNNFSFNTLVGYTSVISANTWNIASNYNSGPSSLLTVNHEFNSNNITLTRGQNDIRAKMWSTSTFRMTGLCSMLYLNYESDKSPLGVWAHNKTIYRYFLEEVNLVTQNVNYQYFGLDNVLTIPESTYYLNNVALYGNSQLASNLGFYNIMATGTEGVSARDSTLFLYQTGTVNEIGRKWFYSQCTQAFRKYPGNENVLTLEYNNIGNYNISAIRDFRFGNTGIGQRNFYWVVTYNNLKNVGYGYVIGYTGDGSGIEINVYNNVTNEQIVKTTTTAGGYYTFTYYDDSIEIVTEAKSGDVYFQSVPHTMSESLEYNIYAANEQITIFS